ncbi:MAG: hypothetical protein B6226_05790, partial [Candidatus Cloacimonetes bacterium 4572_65]
MTYLESIILGIIQGLTEFLPVSSSGHLILGQYFFGIQEPGISFEVMVHLGSLIAVLIYFQKDLMLLIKSFFKVFSKNKSTQDVDNLKIIGYLLVATFVTGVIGIVFKDTFTEFFDNPLLAAIMLSVTGLIVFLSDKMPGDSIKTKDIGVVKSLIIGLGQAFAILPGISRSGTTIAVSLALGVKREDAPRFSFLLSIPAILGATILDLPELVAAPTKQLFVYSSGAVAAFVSGLLVISLLIN